MVKAIAPTPAALITFAGARGSSTEPGTLEIYVMDGAGDNRRLLIAGPEDDWLPTWSPNGDRIAWIAKRDGRRRREVFAALQRVRPRSQRRKEDRVAEITTPRDLFLHELGDIMYVEQALSTEVLPKLISEVTDEEFRDALEEHLEQTKRHLTNVEKVFEQLGAATNRNGAWATRTVPFTSDGSVQITVEAADAGTASLVEAGVDDVTIR